MELEQIKAIITMMKENDLSEFSMEQDGLKIRIKRGPEGVQQTVSLPPVAPAPAVAAAASARRSRRTRARRQRPLGRPQPISNTSLRQWWARFTAPRRRMRRPMSRSGQNGG